MPGNEFNDYPHFGIWPDAYYMTDNQFWNGGSFDGAGVFAFDRAKMLAGDPATSYIYFDLGTSYSGMLPADMDGATPPSTGTPNYFAMPWTSTSLRIFGFHADFATPASSTFSKQPGSPVAVATFDFNGNLVSQPSPATASSYLDSLYDRLMHRLAYRNFGSRESLVVTHTVNVGPDPSTVAGFQGAVRYYELRRNLPSGTFAVAEQATFAPDTDHRWMGSAAMDGQGNLAVGYSVSSTATYPSIRYAGRLATDPANGPYQGEATLIAGTGVQLGSAGRWGDYSALSVDPTDDCTFWYTTEHYTAASQASSSIGWLTRIGSFKFPSCGGDPAGTVTGHVRNAGTGAPIANASVTLEPGGQLTFTNADGLYTLSIAPATYSGTATARFYSTQTASGLVVTNGGRVTQDFTLTFTGGVLTGHVRNASTGGAISGAGINISPGNLWATTDSSGFYSKIVQPGTYTLTTWARNYETSAPISSVLTQGGTTTLDFALTPLVNSWRDVSGPPGPPWVFLEDCLLLTDGSVMCHDVRSSNWWKLTPDILRKLREWDLDAVGAHAIHLWAEVFRVRCTSGRTRGDRWGLTILGPVTPRRAPFTIQSQTPGPL